MKKMILLALASLPVFAFAQGNKFTIQGSVGKLNAPAKVYLHYSLGNTTVNDSSEVKDGKFQLSGLTDADAMVSGYLFLNKLGTGASYDDYQQVYLEPGTITVTGDDAISSAKITGTKTNNDNVKYKAASATIDDAYTALDAKIKATSDEVKQSEAYKHDLNKSIKTISTQNKEIKKKFIQANPDSYISINLLQDLAYNTDYADLSVLYDGLDPKIKASAAGQKYATALVKLKTVALGAMAPEFAQADTAGKMVALSSFKGKYVLVDFWASWCGPCRGENPNVVKAYNRFKGQKFTILGVSLDQPTGKDKWIAAIKKDGLTWTQISDLKYWKNEAAQLYGVNAIPQNFLLDPDGKIIAKNLRGDDLDNKLEELFGKL